jgi:hypothetical protein
MTDALGRECTQPEAEDWVWRCIADSVKAELFWKQLDAIDKRLPALAMNLTPDFGESVRHVLHPDDEVRFWQVVLDGDPVTAKIIVHEIVSEWYASEAT